MHLARCELKGKLQWMNVYVKGYIAFGFADKKKIKIIFSNKYSWTWNNIIIQNKAEW